MRFGRFIGSVFGTGVLTVALLPRLLVAQAQSTVSPEAGKITTLIPTGSVVRAKNTLEAKKDMSVLWLDTIKTDRGGRARIRLGDGSVLNIGSQASMVVTKHDPGKQQTDIELIYGKVRADVHKIDTPDGHFEVHTKVAVCGVVGTQEYLETSDLATTVIALGGGQVRVSSTDPQYPGVVLLNPGETVSVIAGRGAGAKRQASAAEMLRAVEETEGETGATMEPGVSVAGRSFDAIITGKDLASARGVSFSQAGLTIKMRGEPSATQVPVSITVDAAVPVGTYAITIDRPQGPAVAGFAVTSATAITPAATSGPIVLPTAADFSVTRGAKIPLDASQARTPQGTQIVAYQWSVPNTGQTGSGPNFSVNTSLLPPGSYTVQLAVVNDQGTVATGQYPVTVQPGVQPVEIVRDIASAYESLQPSAFLRNFDEERFRNYAGFAAAIEDSFRSKLESMRVFQRPVNCAVVEQQDEGVCQAEFQLQFTLKDQPQELLDSQGNPIPAGTVPPSNATLGKRVLTGSEQDTIRFGRADQGWKVTDYGAVVSCPGGSSTSGVNVGSCVFALGSLATPSFQILVNPLAIKDLPIGGSITGSFSVVPVAGFTGSITFSGQAQVGNQPLTTTFTPNPSGPSSTVSFTILGPATAPPGMSGPAPFTLVITGRDTSGLTTVTANVDLTLQPDFNLLLTPATTSSAPQPVTQNSTLPVTVQIAASAGFTGTALVDFPNLPTGFSANSGNVPIGGQGTFPLAISAQAAPGPALITVRATLSSGAVKTATLFLNVTSDFTLNVTPTSSAANPIQATNLSPLQLNVQVVPSFGFSATVAIDFLNLPAGVTAVGGNVAADSTGNFTLQTAGLTTPITTAITVRGRFGNDVQTIQVFVQFEVAVPIKRGPPLSQGTTATAYAMEPSQLQSGETVIGRIYGKGLDSVTSVDLAGSGIKAEVLDATPTELQVRFTADRTVDGGSRLLTLRTRGTKAATLAIDVVPSRAAKAPIASPVGSVALAEAENTGRAPALEVPQTRAPEVTTDAQTGRVAGAPAKSAPRFGMRQKGDLRVPLNGCTGFRLSSGGEQSCGGSADLEISSRGGTSLVLEADGVRSLGAMSLDQPNDFSTGGLSSAAAVQAGSTYLVKTRRGLALLRVAEARGLESLRNAPPAALRGPRVGGVDRVPVAVSSEPAVTLILEWKTFEQ
jgi:hypothetical protein